MRIARVIVLSMLSAGYALPAAAAEAAKPTASSETQPVGEKIPPTSGPPATSAEAKRDPDDYGGAIKQEGIALARARRTGDYATALVAAQGFVSFSESFDSRHFGHPDYNTAQALQDVAWCDILVNDFQGSLDAVDRSDKILPGKNLVSRARALMFLGRTEEAKSIYLAHRGEKLDSYTWNQAVLDDFTELRNSGLTAPLMKEVEAIFKHDGVAANPPGYQIMTHN